jgi:hypothetical protein
MRSKLRAAFALGVLGALVSCNNVRKKECEQFLTAMQPIDQAAPAADDVDRVHEAIEHIQFEDQPLREFARSAQTTLTVLSNTLALKDDPSRPDGTHEVIKAKLKEARTAKDDVLRYCSQ